MITDDVYKRCRDAAAALGGPPLNMTLSRVAQDALQNHLEYLQQQYNQGKPFPDFKGRIRVGRPVGT